MDASTLSAQALRYARRLGMYFVFGCAVSGCLMLGTAGIGFASTAHAGRTVGVFAALAGVAELVAACYFARGGWLTTAGAPASLIDHARGVEAAADPPDYDGKLRQHALSLVVAMPAASVFFVVMALRL